MANAVERLRTEGDSWWPGTEIAPIAYRRWTTFARRHRCTKRPSQDDYVNDLVKGLQSHFEPDVPYTHPTDWHYLAVALAAVFKEDSDADFQS